MFGAPADRCAARCRAETGSGLLVVAMREAGRSGRVRHAVEELVEGDADSPAPAPPWRCRPRSPRRPPTPQMPSSPTPFAFIGEEIGSTSSRKITSWCGMSAWTGTSYPARSWLTKKPRFRSTASSSIKRRPDAHGHPADDLAAGRSRVEDAPGRADRQHPPHPDLGRVRIDPNLDEMARRRSTADTSCRGRRTSMVSSALEVRQRPPPRRAARCGCPSAPDPPRRRRRPS